jgi:hypothetical protein
MRSACGSKEFDLPLSRFPLRGQAGGTAASATLRLGQCAGPKQNAHPRSGPVRKKCSLIGGYAAPKTPVLNVRPAEELYAANRTFHLLIKADILTC